MKARALRLLLLPAMAAWQAAAAETPVLVPTRDAVVEYQLQGKPGKPPFPVRVHFSGGRIRAEPAALPGYVIVDRAADRVIVVLDGARAFFEVPLQSDAARDYLPSDRMSFIRGGEDRVAGLPCTVWDVKAPQNRTATACVTADGLVLRGEGRDPRYGSGSLQAVSVSYAPQPPDLFQPPADYQRLPVPNVPGLTDSRPPR